MECGISVEDPFHLYTGQILCTGFRELTRLRELEVPGCGRELREHRVEGNQPTKPNKPTTTTK